MWEVSRVRLSRAELREHERKLKRIEIQGERKLLEAELKRKREEYWPKRKPISRAPTPISPAGTSVYAPI